MGETGIIVQARMGSTRLPGKVMMPLVGKLMLEHVLDRLRDVNQADRVIVATTDSSDDDVIMHLAERMKTKFFRGSEDDVLKRYFMAAKSYGLDVIVRITSDCPLIDPQIIDLMINRFNETGVDYLSNTQKRTFPRGLDVEIFSFHVLEKAFNEAREDYEREHVTPYITQRPETFKLKNYECHTDNSHYRWTVDTPEDFELITKIYESLYRDGEVFLLDDVLELYKKHPELAEINRHVEQKAVSI